MRTLKDNSSVGVFGENWAEQTADIIKVSRVCESVNVFHYTERESLFIDQYDFFLITDFGDLGKEWSVQYRDKLNEMREIIYTRSMKTVLFANNDDADISTSLREAGCRVVRVNNLRRDRIPERFASLLLCELCGFSDFEKGRQNHHFPSTISRRLQTYP